MSKDLWSDFCSTVKPIEKKSIVLMEYPLVNSRHIGRRSIARSIDLHNLSLEDAYRTTRDFIEDSHVDNAKKIVVITGKSGQIREEFARWVEKNHRISNITLRKDGGSYSIKLKRT